MLHEFRAQGPLSSTLLGVVALDDAIGIILFGLVLAITGGVTITTGLGIAVLGIAGSVLLGSVAGYALSVFGGRRRRSLRLPVILAAILIVLGLAEHWGFSPLLASIVLGFSARHFVGTAGERLFAPIEYFEELIFIVFFTVAGAHFQPAVFSDHLDLIISYFVARVLGKYVGASASASIARAPHSVSRWLGFGLVPQAGVAVGLALTLSQQPALAEISDVIVNVILGTTLLYELLGPLMVEFALKRSGEASIKRRREQT